MDDPWIIDTKQWKQNLMLPYHQSNDPGYISKVQSAENDSSWGLLVFSEEINTVFIEIEACLNRILIFLAINYGSNWRNFKNKTENAFQPQDDEKD